MQNATLDRGSACHCAPRERFCRVPAR